jgi:HSP20 family protein
MATLVRRNPVFFRVFRELNGNGTTTGAVARDWAPALDAWETEDEVVYAFDLPGTVEEKIAVELENGVLTVSAERERSGEVKQDGFYRYERRVGNFTRTISLPEGVTDDSISASYGNGVLEVRVRKPEETKPRRIEIGVNGQKTIEGTVTEA